jgi:hypothetical protein
VIIRGNFVTRWLARLIARRAAAMIAQRPPDFVIGGHESPYLKRWYVFPRNTWGNIYIHEYHRPDDDRALHDHPWRSFSLCLSGTIIDVTKSVTKPVSVGDVALRSANNAHRIDLPPGQIGQRTLFIMGPRVREWGFHCPKGWVPWKEFTASNETGDSSRVGRGCE